MKKFVYLFSICALLSVQSVFAQTTVTGKVLSNEDKTPIAGASVSVKGTTVGTMTDENGLFTLQAPATATTLVISYIGMERQEVAVAPNVEVLLAVDNQPTCIGRAPSLITSLGTTTVTSIGA